MNRILFFFASFFARRRSWVNGLVYSLMLISAVAGSPVFFLFAALAIVLNVFGRRPDEIRFVGHLQKLLEAGNSPSEAVRRLGSGHRGLKRATRRALHLLDNGAPLHEALNRSYYWFPKRLRRLIEEGERRNALVEYLRLYLDCLTFDREYKNNRKRTLAYPVILAVIGIGGLIMFLVFVIPVFKSMFADFGYALPLLTQTVINISNLFSAAFPYLILLVAVVFALDWFTAFRPLARLRSRRDAYWLLSLMRAGQKNGVRLFDSLLSAARILKDRQYLKAAGRLVEEEKNGLELSPRAVKRLPRDLVTQLAALYGAHDVSGALDKGISMYRLLFQVRMHRRWRYIYVALFLFNGFTLGGMVIAMYLPIFRMAMAVGP